MKPIVCLAIILALLTGCRKDHGYQNSGTIIGADFRKCMCCGGWIGIILIRSECQIRLQ